MKNKGMMDMVINMMKSGDENSPIIQMMRQQMPNASPKTTARVMKCLAYVI